MLHKAILLAIFVMLSPDLWLPVRISTVVHMHSLSIKEFVNTSEPIWTYKTTEIPQIRCLSHLMRSIHPMFIEFNRTHLYRNRVVRLAQRGQFSTALPERMTITDMGGLRMSVEYLLYKAPDSSCAVVKVRCSFDLIENCAWCYESLKTDGRYDILHCDGHQVCWTITISV
ncbi:uncharacterized protein LOC142586877 isoform X2 [Dermacentor variabilis]|uniref:uncharacterized protein LOC142586877 isoform X2 n=1 Tax=Dermacentor variabilis TaxID=34621 RepID=UPI003F5BB3FB